MMDYILNPNIDLSKAKLGEPLSYVPVDFDLTKEDISTLEIIETNDKNNCYIRSKNTYTQYHSFVLAKNSRTITLCEVHFSNQKLQASIFLARLFARKRFLMVKFKLVKATIL